MEQPLRAVEDELGHDDDGDGVRVGGDPAQVAEERVTEVDDVLEDDVGHINPSYREGTGYQSPRYAQFTVSLDF